LDIVVHRLVRLLFVVSLLSIVAIVLGKRWGLLLLDILNIIIELLIRLLGILLLYRVR
jgi:hypothetical protein